MAMSVASQSRDNLLEALRVQTEERKNEVKEIFLELRTALGQCEEGVDRELSELYSNTRERVERDGKKIQKLEKAKVYLQTDLVDNEFNSILQSTLDNFDAQIAEIRRCSVAIPTDVKLEWHKKELKSSILKVCKIVSSDNVRNSDGRNPAIAATQDLELEVQRLTRKNEDSQREFKKVEEEYKYTIAKLEARITEKEKEMSHRNEELRSTQDELRRFSERSQVIIYRHDADNSKYDESLLLIEEYKKRVSELKETISGLKQEADNSRATHNQSDSENNALQIEVNDLKCELSRLESERENLFSEIRQITNEKDQFMRALTAQAQTINQSAKKSKGIFDESGEQQLLLERIMELEGESKKKDEAMQQLSVQSGDLLRKCSLLEKDLKQLKSSKSIGDVYEGNLVTIREKERMLKETLRNNEEFQQRIQDLEMALVIEKSESEESKVEVRDLRKEIQILEKNLLFRETESGQMRQENLKMKLELNKARSVLVSNFNSQNQNKAEEVGHDDEKSMFSISQSLGLDFLPDERRQKMELDERVSQMNSYIKELKQKLQFCSEENESIRKQLRTKERELDSVKQKLILTEENLSATQTYLDEEQFKLKLKEKGAKKMEIPDPASGTTLTAPTAPTTRSTKQTKYKYTTIFFAKKKTQVYSLNQVENPKDQLGGIVMCRSNMQKYPYSDWVAGTLKTIIPPKFRGDKSIAGVEFLNPLGSCDDREDTQEQTPHSSKDHPSYYQGT